MKRTLFHLLDANQEHVVSITDFIEGCLTLRGHAKQIGLREMMYETRWLMDHLVDFTDRMDNEMARQRDMKFKEIAGRDVQRLKLAKLTEQQTLEAL